MKAHIVQSIVIVLAAALTVAGCAGVVPRPDPLSIEQVVQLSRDRVNPAEIIQRMQQSGGFYRLPASDLARLHDQGVADAVIDYMQATYLDAVRREEALRLFSAYNWPGPVFMPGPAGRAYRP